MKSRKIAVVGGRAVGKPNKLVDACITTNFAQGNRPSQYNLLKEIFLIHIILQSKAHIAK